MRQKLLLIEDVDTLGRSGDVVSVKSGYARNYLVPQGRAVVADKHTLLIQEKLKEERAKRALEEKKQAEEMAKAVEGIELVTEVKVDPEGHMYGSVSALDIVHLFAEKGMTVEKGAVLISKPIKKVGTHEITLRFKEDVSAKCSLKVVAEGTIEEEKTEKTEEENA